MSEGEIIRKFLAINILVYACLEFIVFAVGIDMLYVGGKLFYIVLMGVPYIFLALSLILTNLNGYK